MIQTVAIPIFLYSPPDTDSAVRAYLPRSGLYYPVANLLHQSPPMANSPYSCIMTPLGLQPFGTVVCEFQQSPPSFNTTLSQISHAACFPKTPFNLSISSDFSHKSEEVVHVLTLELKLPLIRFLSRKSAFLLFWDQVSREGLQIGGFWVSPVAYSQRPRYSSADLDLLAQVM